MHAHTKEIVPARKPAKLCAVATPSNMAAAAAGAEDPPSSPGKGAAIRVRLWVTFIAIGLLIGFSSRFRGGQAKSKKKEER